MQKRIRRVGPPHGVCREFTEFVPGKRSRYTTTVRGDGSFRGGRERRGAALAITVELGIFS